MKDSTGNIIRDEKEILSRWRNNFEDLSNPVRATPTVTYDTIDFGKEVFILKEVAAAIRRLKSGKAAGENEIQPKMFESIERERVSWLTRVCQVAWKLGKTP